MMILAHLSFQVEYGTILDLLKVRSFGASGQNLKYLAALGFIVIYREGSIEELSHYCQQGYPSIVCLGTDR